MCMCDFSIPMKRTNEYLRDTSWLDEVAFRRRDRVAYPHEVEYLKDPEIIKLPISKIDLSINVSCNRN